MKFEFDRFRGNVRSKNGSKFGAPQLVALGALEKEGLEFSIPFWLRGVIVPYLAFQRTIGHMWPDCPDMMSLGLVHAEQLRLSTQCLR